MILKSALIFFLFFSSTHFMADPTWDELAKNQTDSQLITEYVTAAIIAHESDPTAHLGDGESLQQHKANDIIDHPALSIVPDKFSNARSFMFFNVVPTVSGNEDNCNIQSQNPLAGISQDSGFSGDGSYLIGNFIPGDVGYDGGDIIVDFMMTAAGATGSWYARFDASFFRLRMESSAIKFSYYDGTWHETTLGITNTGSPMRFRVLYDSDNNMLYLLERDVQVYSHSYTIDFLDTEFTPLALISKGSATIVIMGFGNISVWMDGV